MIISDLFLGFYSISIFVYAAFIAISYTGTIIKKISIPNILIHAGGINKTGTLRNIFKQRNGVLVDTIDLYPMITGIGLVNEKQISESLTFPICKMINEYLSL